MKKIAIILLVAALVCAGIAAVAEPDKPFAGTTLNVFNWYDYIDEAVLDLFTEQTGIEINYAMFTQNEDMYAKLEAGWDYYDVIFPSEYMIERLIKEDRLAELDLDNVPNLENVLDNLRDPSYDPGNAHSVPYMWGTLGILYNTDLVSGPITSWRSLFDEQYKGSIFMMNSLRDTIGLGLKTLGYSMNTRDEAQLREACDLLVQQKRDGLVSGNFVDETKDKMVAGEGILGLVWSGDAQYAINLNDKLAYVVPKEGSNVWVDGMVIPKAAKNPENAMKFIDFLCRPDIAQMNTEYIEYSSPNQAAIDLMGEEYLNNPNLNPPQEVIDGSEFFSDIQDFITIYNTLWAQVKNAK